MRAFHSSFCPSTQAPLHTLVTVSFGLSHRAFFLSFTPTFQTRSSARVLRKKEERKVSECDGGGLGAEVDNSGGSANGNGILASSSSTAAAAAVTSSSGNSGGSSNVNNATTPSSRRSWEQWSSEDKVMNTGTYWIQ